MARLDAVRGLWKVKDDEKIRDMLAKIINTTTDLNSLASEHNIEGQQLEGGGLEKVFSLLGDQRQRKFRSKMLILQWEKRRVGKAVRISEVRAEFQGKISFGYQKCTT